MKACSLRHRFLFPLLAAGLAPLPLSAAPRDELLRLVPEDVGFCLVVQDLRGHLEQLQGSPFVQQFHRSPLGQVLHNAKEMQKLLEVEKQLQKSFRLDWARLRDDIFGDAIVLAYRPGPPDKPGQEQDLILIRARDAEFLVQLVDRINQAQKGAGELQEVEPRQHQGQKYFRRVEKKRLTTPQAGETQEGFYYLHGPVLALSSREDVVRQVIERDNKVSAEEPVVARQLRLLGVERRLAALWINPRAFDAAMEQKASGAATKDVAAVQKMLTFWKALEGLALALDVQKDIELSLALRVQTERLSPAAKRFFSAAARLSELWERFPDNALLAVAERVDVPALFDLLGELLTDKDRENLWHSLDSTLGAALGRSLSKEVLPCIGPDMGLCITAPASSDPGWFPQAVLAIRLSPGDTLPAVDQALLSVVNALALIVVFDYNRQHTDQLSLKTVSSAVGEVKHFVNENLPPGLSPAFGLQNGFLIFASSPEALRRFASAPRAPIATDELPLFRLSLKDLRQFLKERREPLAQAVAEKNQMKKEEAERRLDALLLGLQFFDRLEVTQRPAPGQVMFTLHLQTSQPLRK